MSDTYLTTYPKARTAHVCEWCRRLILPRERYERQVALVDGGVDGAPEQAEDALIAAVGHGRGVGSPRGDDQACVVGVGEDVSVVEAAYNGRTP